MSAAAERAKARREAILNARGNRLAKLTSSARGEDPGGVYHDIHKDSPGSGFKKFVGEETTLPTPPNIPGSQSSPQPQAMHAPHFTDEAAEEQLRNFMNSMAGKDTPSSERAAPQVPEDPLSMLLTSITGQDSSASVPFVPLLKPKTFLQKLLPLLHLLSMVGLLLFFVVWQEPRQFIATANQQDNHGAISVTVKSWSRWANLSKRSPVTIGTNVVSLPAFFWAFTTVELVLHTLRLFSGLNGSQHPMLLSLILPYLPPSLSQTISTSLNYLQLVGLVLDDLAILLFGLGAIIYISSWRI